MLPPAGRAALTIIPFEMIRPLSTWERTMTGIRDRYNSFLDSNVQLNAFSSLRDDIRKVRRGHLVGLVAVLVASGIASTSLSLLASIMGYGNAGQGLIWPLVATATTLFINNLAFSVFLLRVRGQRFTGETFQLFTRLIVVQLLCAVVLAVAQTFALNIVLSITSFSARINTLCSIAVSLIFTLLNALVAYRVLDGTHRVRDIMPGFLEILWKHAADLLLLSVLFIGWSFAANTFYASMLYDHLTQVQTINNVFHALLNQQEFALAGQVAGFYLVNFIVGGLFEVDLLLGLGIYYDRDKEHVFK